MRIKKYNEFYNSYFEGERFKKDFESALEILKTKKRVFFVGNGGSNSICSHMMEDYAKLGRFQSFCFSDPALITCFANDYGYEDAMAEWLEVYLQEDDLLIAISSSGNSANILNAVKKAKEKGGDVISLSGFRSDNKLREEGGVNFFLEVENYGIVECFHHVIVHALLDEYVNA